MNMLITYTKVIDETLSPTWDQLLLIPSVLVYGTRCHTYTFTILPICIMLFFFPVVKVLFIDKHHSQRLWVNLSLVPCSRYFPPLSGRISRCPLPSQWSRCGTRTRWFQINLEGLKMTIVKYFLTKLRTAIGTMPRTLEDLMLPRTLEDLRSEKLNSLAARSPSPKSFCRRIWSVFFGSLFFHQYNVDTSSYIVISSYFHQNMAML